MTTRAVLLAALASLLCAAPAAAHVDGMTLRATRGPAGGEVKLDWTGGQPLFQVYRSTQPMDVLSPANQIAESANRTYLDAPPAATILYYQVASPCVYDPPEICDGLDNDCNGFVDDRGSEASCNLPHAIAACSQGSCVVAACDAGFDDCNGAQPDGCEADLASDPAHCGACTSSCDDQMGCTADTCAESTCQNVDRSLCVATPEQDPDACGANGCDVCSYAATETGCVSPDSDGDGLTDAWEDAGWIDLDCDGVLGASDAPLPNANKKVKDVYLKLSWMTNAPAEPNLQHRPSPESVDFVVAAFAGSHLPAPPVPCDGSPGGGCPPGLVCSIADHVCLPFCQTDSQCTTGRCVDGVCLERRLHVDPVINEIPHADVLFFGPVQPACITGGDTSRGVNFYDLKLDPGNFDPRKALFMRYGVFGHFNSCDSPETCGDPACVTPVGSTAAQPKTTGLAEVQGNDLVVSLGGTAWIDPQDKTMHEAGALMHELGHTLGLHHGGPACDPPNDPSCLNAPTQDRKVNQLSVMNHLYALGIPFAALPGSTVPSGTRFDYSRYVLPRLYEPCLDEPLGLVPGSPGGFEKDLVQYVCARGAMSLVRYGSTAPGQPIDWNCDGTLDTCVQANINDWPPGAPADETHEGAEEWSRLKYRFQCGAAFVD